MYLFYGECNKSSCPLFVYELTSSLEFVENWSSYPSATREKFQIQIDFYNFILIYQDYRDFHWTKKALYAFQIDKKSPIFFYIIVYSRTNKQKGKKGHRGQIKHYYLLLLNKIKAIRNYLNKRKTNYCTWVCQKWAELS